MSSSSDPEPPLQSHHSQEEREEEEEDVSNYVEGSVVDSLDDSERVNINVRNLSVRVSQSALGSFQKFSPIFIKKKDKSTSGEQMAITKEISTHDNHEDVEKRVATPQVVKSEFILQNISLDVPAGRLMAIIGGSGSGKTTLLNMLARRMSANNLDVEGQVLFNGLNSIDNVKNAYVLQQDVLQPKLTCRETLLYAAELRLPKLMSKEERRAKVEEVILELGLKECADTRVGDSAHKGLSGGEQRRLSIGIQLIGNPSVIFLDEPTTGLDANSAYLLVKTCHELAARGRTLIMSLHQPRSDIFFLFDDITILTGGQAVYSGAVNNVVQYFGNLGYSFPKHVNPADHLIDLSIVDSRSDEKERASKSRVDALIQAWKDYQQFGPPMVAQVNPNKKLLLESKAPWTREVYALTRRSLTITYRDPVGFLGLICEAVLMGLLVGLIFYKSLDGGTQAGIRSTEGCLYIVISMQSYLLLIFETYRQCRSDMVIFDREYTEGTITVSGYLISRRIAKLFTEDIIVPLIFTVRM